jgi:hypothetical protein
MYTQDINELTISGHVNEPPRLAGDPTTCQRASSDQGQRTFLAGQLDAEETQLSPGFVNVGHGVGPSDDSNRRRLG